MEKASRRSWTGVENSPRTMQLREYGLREFWEILVDDRPFCRDACFWHANVQSKAVFSFAMTIKDAIHGWEDEEKRVGSKFAACGSTEVLTRGQMFITEKEEYLKKRMMSILLCTNWACAGTFEDHEWVSESTITQHAEDVMGMELDYEIGVPRVVQWCMLWFSAPARLNGTLEKQDLKIKYYHEFVNMANTDAISISFGGEHTPRSCMLASMTKVLHKTHRKW